MKKFLLSLVSLLLCALSAVAAGNVKIAYAGSTTQNMTGENDAALFGLSAEEWSIVGDKGKASNMPGLNKDGSCRIYYNVNGSNTITITVLKEDCTIKKITGMTFNTGYDNVTVSVGDNPIEPVDGEYAINATSFVLGNGNTSNKQVQIQSIILDVEGMEGNYVEVHIANDAETAYSVARAIELIEAGDALDELVYVRGIVSQVDNFNAGAIQYWISDDGTTTNQFECYKGKGIGGADFASIDDVKVGASVIVKGTMKKYTPKEGDPIYEFNQNNELVNYEAPAEPVYIQNADFASLEGWTAVTSESYKDLGNGLIGEYNVRISPATVDETHLATEYCLGFECRWNTNFASYTQTVTTLPAGSYSLVYDVENVNAATTAADYENRFTVTVGETVYSDSFTEWMKGKSAWTTHAIVFTVEEGQQVTISLGYGTGSNNFSADNTPAIYVSHLKLADAATGEALILAKAKEEKLAVLDAFVAGEGLFQYSQRAIEVAKRAVNAANTVEEVEAVDMPTPTLPDAEKQYTLQQKASGLYMSLSDGVKLAAKAYPLSWVATEGGWYIKNEDLYVGLAGSDNWTMSTDADKKLVITPAAIDIEGVVYYTLSEVKGMIASDGTEAGSACYTDKSVAKSGDKAYWTIAEYVAPTLYSVSIAEGLENGTVAAEPTSAEAGTKIQLTATPAEGYALESYSVTCKTIDEVVLVAEDGTFTMPADDVTVSATFVEAGPAPVVWESYTGWVRGANNGDVATARYFGITTPGTASDAYALDAFQICHETGNGAASRYAVIATAAPEGTSLAASNVIAVSSNAVEPTTANPGKFETYSLSKKVLLKGATTYYVVFTTANEPAEEAYPVGAQRVSLNLSYGTYAPGLADGSGNAKTNWTPGFKAQLTIPAFAITCANVENGTIETDVAEAYPGDKVTVTATPAEGYKLKNITVTCKTIDLLVEVAEDGSFIMPADEVTVSATFQDLASVVYIETDLTSQFSSLTDWRKWIGATGYTATDYCPAVTTNAGQTVQVCEKYVANCTETGDIFYQTLTGLAEGTYKIELYGGAAFTFGRGFGSQAFTGETGTGDAWGTHTSETYTAGQHIDTETGVKLYAVTSEGEFGGEIPIYYATNFPDGAAVVTLNDVKVGSNGELKIGMSKTSQSTNWHVIQLKSVIATVDATALLAHSVAAANAVDPTTIPAALATQINETVEANNKEYETADEYKTAIAAIDAVVAKAAPYAPLTAALNQGETYKANSSDEDAKAAYDAAIADVKVAYDAVAVEDFAAAIATVKAALPALARTQTAPGSDLTVFITNADISDHANGWTIERPIGGGGPELPAGGSLEYWAGSASDRAKASFDYYQVIEDLPNGRYTVSADLFNSLNDEGGAYTVFAATSGVYAAAGGAEVSKLVDVDGITPITYTTDAIIVTDGTLRIGVKNVTTPMAARWFVADNFKLTLINTISDDMVPYYAALNSIEDGETYMVSTEVGEKKFYLNNTGYLVADAQDASVFEMKKVTANGTLYETGINLGCKFTNPTLTNGSSGDIVKNGHIMVGGNDRNDWERQVFFLKDGKYAVRATNANSANWGANTYWTVDNVEAELPNAEYALAAVYVWNIEKTVDRSALDADIAALEAIIAATDSYVEIVENAAQSATTALTPLKEAVYTTTQQAKEAQAAVKTIGKTFLAGIKAVTPIDVTSFYIVNAGAQANKAVPEGWEGTAANAASDGVSEFWNQSAADLHQTITLPTGDYRLTAVALQRTDFTGVVYAGEDKVTIAQVERSVANSRSEAAAWFAAGNGKNEVYFIVPETGELTIGLTADKDHGDHWTVWQSFKLEKIADAARPGALSALTKALDANVPNPATAGEGLFQKSQEAYETYERAYNTQKAVAEDAEATSQQLKDALVALETAVETYAAAPVTLPEAGSLYTFQQKESGKYLSVYVEDGSDGVRLADEAQGFSLTVTDGGYYLSNEIGYVGLEGSDNWTMSALEANKLVINSTPYEVVEGVVYYTLSEVKGLIATDGTEAGAACYADKGHSDKALWAIAEYVAPGPESVDYAGILEQTVVNRQTGEQVGETTTDDQTITLIDAGEGLVDIKVNGGFTLPIGMKIPEFTIKGVTVVVSQETGSATYSYAGSVSFPQGQITVTYEATLTGYQASVEATPVFCVVLTQSFIDTIYFGADADAIAAYKTATGIKDVKGAQNVGTIYDLSGRKVEKMVKGGIYIVNGKKVSFK